jgi:nucleoside recognition membrane protein YjiH
MAWHHIIDSLTIRHSHIAMRLQHLFLQTNSTSLAYQALQTVLIIYVLSTLYTVIIRLYFHPLVKVPGPRIAAMTSWYEFYQDVIRNGTYPKELPKLHKYYSKTAEFRCYFH